MKTTSLALLCALSMFSAPAAQSEEFTGDALFPWLTAGRTVSLYGNRPIYVGGFSGILIFEDESSPLHNAMIQCPGYNDITISAVGYCVISDTDGDKVYMRWTCEATRPEGGDFATCVGAAKLYAGTGKFEDRNDSNTQIVRSDLYLGTGTAKGVTGSNTYTAHTLAIDPDGTISGYSSLSDFSFSY